MAHAKTPRKRPARLRDVTDRMRKNMSPRTKTTPNKKLPRARPKVFANSDLPRSRPMSKYEVRHQVKRDMRKGMRRVRKYVK